MDNEPIIPPARVSPSREFIRGLIILDEAINQCTELAQKEKLTIEEIESVLFEEQLENSAEIKKLIIP
jgi:hypothetical protein